MESLEELTEHVLSGTKDSSLGTAHLVADDSIFTNVNIIHEQNLSDHGADNNNLVVTAVVVGEEHQRLMVRQDNEQSGITTSDQHQQNQSDFDENGGAGSTLMAHTSSSMNEENAALEYAEEDCCEAGGSDRLTDSNSSEKLSSSFENPVMSDVINQSDDNNAEEIDSVTDNIPMNFPIKGRILARLRLHGKGYEYFMTKMKLVIGRNSSKGAVDIDIGHSSFISRNHLTIVYDNGNFYLSCGGKNGVFVDDMFQKIGAPRLLLPKSCALRFPSTQIVIIFDAAERFIDQYSTANSKNVTTYEIGHAPKTLKALSVQIPENGRVGELRKTDKSFFSPCPSPTGTMSAVNSCPTSPTSAVVYSRSAAATSQRSIKPKFVTDAVVAKDERIPLFEGDDCKPPYSYAQLIVQAISSTEEKQMTLSGIYGYIARNYSYFKGNERGWQNSIRHNLSLNRYFIKISRALDEPGKGCFWSIDPVSEPKLVAQAFRRRNKRGIPFFRGTPKSLKTQSAPVSPTPIILHPAIYSSGKSSNTVAVATGPGLSTTSTVPPVVTVATVNSIAEAVTMQLKKSHVLDLNNIRSIQSAPGSPQGYKVVSPASLIATKVVPKGMASVIGSKSSGITLLHPVTNLASVSSAPSGDNTSSIITLTSQQVQLLQTAPTISHVSSTSSTPVVPTVVSTLPSDQMAVSQANQGQPIYIHLAPGGLPDQVINADGQAAKVIRLEES